MTLISSLATGLPSFVLTLEPNTTRVQGHFLRTVFSKSLPGAFCILLAVIGVYCFDVLGHQNFNLYTILLRCVLYLPGCNALCVLISVCKPMTKFKNAFSDSNVLGLYRLLHCTIFTGLVLYWIRGVDTDTKALCAYQYTDNFRSRFGFKPVRR